MENPKFPDSFRKKGHSLIPGATQWLLTDSKGENIISIVGGGAGLYGDGVVSFEMYDFREEDVKGHLTPEEINKHLAENPIG